MKMFIAFLFVNCFVLSCFAVCPSMDFTGDCKVDFADFVLFAAQWLNEGEPNSFNIVWVSISDLGVDDTGDGIPDHEGFDGQMSKYETTNAQYCQFLNEAYASGDIIVDGSYVKGANGSNPGMDFAGQYYYNLAGEGDGWNGATNGGAARINWTGSTFTVDSGFENHPLTYVSWHGATAFASYYGWRLPTEWEWQAVADFNGSYTYGCGPTINVIVANYNGSIHPDGTTVVGAFGTYGYGLCDLAGNVWEWTDSCYYANCNPDSPTFRGGSWQALDSACTVSYRGVSSGGLMYSSVGFRMCR